MTAPWEFYQFWVNTDDRDVETYLNALTFLPRAEIADLMARHAEDPGARIPHHALARDLTGRVHGDADAVEREARNRFGALDPRKVDPRQLDPDTLRRLAASMPSGPLPPGTAEDTPLVELLTGCGLVASKSEARRQIQQGGIVWNGERVSDWGATAGAPLPGGYYWATRGKKKDFLFTPAP